MPFTEEELKRHIDDLLSRLKKQVSEKFTEVIIEGDAPSGKSQAILPRQRTDEKRDVFTEMRRLARTVGSSFSPNDRLQTLLFYKQAKFMESFEDKYDGNASFSMYFPNYQMMSNEQLRTYFTWRSAVRTGTVKEISLSYVFVYVYELINNIGVKDCRDGLNKLAFIWKEYRKYDKSLDRYMNGWVKDYYITNDFSVSFDELISSHEVLSSIYRRSAPQSYYDFYFPYSDYKIKQSIFFTPETEGRITGCFSHVVKALTDYMDVFNRDFEDLIFYGKGGAPWQPFKKALYCIPSKTKNKLVRISDTEKYRCFQGRWTSSKNKVCIENGHAIIGYILKRTEQFYRKAEKFKYKLTANKTKIDLAKVGLIVPDVDAFFAKIDSAILEFYKNSQKKTITVNLDNLEIIRAKALDIQERLTVEDEFEPEPDLETEPEPKPDTVPTPVTDAGDMWEAFASSLNKAEREILLLALKNAPDAEIVRVCRECGALPEVVVDNINQKAFDFIGDNVLEFADTATVYEEYRMDLERVMFL